MVAGAACVTLAGAKDLVSGLPQRPPDFAGGGTAGSAALVPARVSAGLGITLIAAALGEPVLTIT